MENTKETSGSHIQQSEIFYGKGSAVKGFIYLPYPRPYIPPAKPNAQFPENPNLVTEFCATKIIMGAASGYFIGIAMGLFMGAMGDVSPIQIIHGREVPHAPMREQARAAFKGVKSRSVSWGKNFCVLTALFGGVECVIEKYRAKHDVWNAALSGCVVGATLSAKQGPAAACFGCVGFGGFSLVVDKLMGGLS
jgi:import inner membrane translocase subunit TIM22